MNNQFSITGSKSISMTGVKNTSFVNTINPINNIKPIGPIYDDSFIIAYDEYKERDEHLLANMFATTVSVADFQAEITKGKLHVANFIVDDILIGRDKEGNATGKLYKELTKKLGKTWLPDAYEFIMNKNNFSSLQNIKMPMWCSEIPVFDMMYAASNYDSFSGKMIGDTFVKNGFLRYGKNISNKTFGTLVDENICKSVADKFALPGPLKNIKSTKDLAKLCKNPGIGQIVSKTAVQTIGKVELTKFGGVAGVELLFQFGGDMAMQLITTGEYDFSKNYGTNIYKGAVTTVFSIAGDFIALTPLGKPGKAALQALGATLADATLQFFQGDTPEETQLMQACAGGAILVGGAVGLVVGIFVVAGMTPPIGWAFAIVAGAILAGAALGALIVWLVFNFDKVVEKVKELAVKAVKVVCAVVDTVVDFFVDTAAVIAEKIETVKKVVEEAVEEVVEKVMETVEEFVDCCAKVVSGFKSLFTW